MKILKAMKREILFKNLSSTDKKRRVFSSSITNEGKDFISTTQRKYVYLIKPVEDHKNDLQTQVFVRNEKNIAQHIQKFNCLIKGGFYASNSENLYLIRYAHSLQILLKSQPH